MDRPPSPIERIQENLLAKSERRLLNWLCARLPSWTKPDHLTALGIAGAVMIFFGFAASHEDRDWLWLSIAGFLVHWFGDSLDGSLARFRRIERPRFGYFIDHSADGFGTMLIVGGLGLSPFVELEVAMLALVGYLLMSIHAFLAARVIGELRLSYVAAGPTELRLMLIAFTLAMYLWGGRAQPLLGYSPFDIIVGLAGLFLILLFIVQTTRTARRIAIEGEWDHGGRD